jgi:Tfp pilus assembly protein PilP
MGTKLTSRLILFLALWASIASATQKRDFGEYFYLDSLHYVGLENDPVRASAGEPNRAVLRSACGAEFEVAVGEYIGKNAGRIIRIDARQIVVQELLPDGDGQWVERIQRLMLEPGWTARPPTPNG